MVAFGYPNYPNPLQTPKTVAGSNPGKPGPSKYMQKLSPVNFLGVGGRGGSLRIRRTPARGSRA